MQIKEMRLSFVQVESQTGMLRSFTPTGIPFSFLLDSGLYQGQATESMEEQGECRTPWNKGYGRRFWSSYNEKPEPTAKALWESLVPFKLDLEPKVSAGWLKGNARARAYLYPWGIATMLDISIVEPLEITAAVDRSVTIRRGDSMEMGLNGSIETGPAATLLASLRRFVRRKAYGPNAAEGSCSDLFTIVTVLDADGANKDDVVTQGSPLHKQLNGFARGTPNWNSIRLDPIANDTLATRPASGGSILFGTRRGRAAWFPESFKSAGPLFKNSLRCYHQNLTIATLHVESLCILAKDAASWLAAGTAHNAWPINYDRCARNTAGLLGRLNGGPRNKTYGSHSIQHQIEKSYEDEVNALRKEYGMPALT